MAWLRIVQESDIDLFSLQWSLRELVEGLMANILLVFIIISVWYELNNRKIVTVIDLSEINIFPTNRD